MPYDGGFLGEDRDVQISTLTGFGGNPNVGAVLMIGGNPPKLEHLAKEMPKCENPVEYSSMDVCNCNFIT